METQGSQRSPPRPVEDQARLRRTDRGPIDRQGVPALRAEEEQEHGAIGQRCVDPMRRRFEPWPHHRRILALIIPELLPRVLGFGRGNIERHRAVIRHEAAVDADSSQNQRSLLGIGKRLKPANFDKLRHMAA